MPFSQQQTNSNPLADPSGLTENHYLAAYSRHQADRLGGVPTTHHKESQAPAPFPGPTTTGGQDQATWSPYQPISQWTPPWPSDGNPVVERAQYFPNVQVDNSVDGMSFQYVPKCESQPGWIDYGQRDGRVQSQSASDPTASTSRETAFGAGVEKYAEFQRGKLPVVANPMQENEPIPHDKCVSKSRQSIGHGSELLYPHYIVEESYQLERKLRPVQGLSQLSSSAPVLPTESYNPAVKSISTGDHYRDLIRQTLECPKKDESGMMEPGPITASNGEIDKRTFQLQDVPNELPEVDMAHVNLQYEPYSIPTVNFHTGFRFDQLMEVKFNDMVVDAANSYTADCSVPSSSAYIQTPSSQKKRPSLSMPYVRTPSALGKTSNMPSTAGSSPPLPKYDTLPNRPYIDPVFAGTSNYIPVAGTFGPYPAFDSIGPSVMFPTGLFPTDPSPEIIDDTLGPQSSGPSRSSSYLGTVSAIDMQLQDWRQPQIAPNHVSPLPTGTAGVWPGKGVQGTEGYQTVYGWSIPGDDHAAVQVIPGSSLSQPSYPPSKFGSPHASSTSSFSDPNHPSFPHIAPHPHPHPHPQASSQVSYKPLSLSDYSHDPLEARLPPVLKIRVQQQEGVRPLDETANRVKRTLSDGSGKSHGDAERDPAPRPPVRQKSTAESGPPRKRGRPKKKSLDHTAASGSGSSPVAHVSQKKKKKKVDEVEGDDDEDDYDHDDDEDDEAEGREHHTGRRSLPKTSIACSFCRLKKLKCDGKRPCHFCIKRGEEGCTFQASLRRRGPGKHNRKKTEPTDGPFAYATPLFNGVAQSSDTGKVVFSSPFGAQEP